MKKYNKLLRLNQSGQTLVLTLIILTAVMVMTLVIISGSLTFFQNARYATERTQALHLAEAGIDKAVASFNSTAGTYNGETDTQLGAGVFSIKITSKDASTSIIESTGYVPNSTSPKAKRTIQIQISKGTGISFVYGMLVGNGGISLGNGSKINGSIYANGSITGGNNEIITGDVFIAGGTQATADQQSDCVSPNCADYVFGKNVGGQNILDVAQSFKPQTTAVINKVSLKLKKTGSPPNITVRLLGDSAGKPNKGTVLASGILSANLVTNQYGFVEVTFSTTPLLTADTIYWIVLDTSSDTNNFWEWSKDTIQGYTRGAAAFSPDWQAKNPVWTAVNGDLGFKTWMGGLVTGISMNSGSIVQGNVHAHSISGVTINKDAYYQTITNSTVQGTSYPNSTDPAPVAMPISDGNINDWQNDAAGYDTTSTPVNGCPTTLGPGKIDASVTITNNCTVTVTTPIWITGNLYLNNASILKMNPSLGASSGVIIVDGQTTFTNSNDLLGTGESGSFLTLLSTLDTPATGLNAIETGNSSITGILYAPKGVVNLANNANFKEIVAYQINAGNNTILTYDSGLISTFFSAGPSGSFSVIKGTYQAK